MTAGRRRVSFLVALVGLVGLVGLALVQGATLLTGRQAPRDARPAEVTILHFNDAHEMDAADGGRTGGLARIATLADRLRTAAQPLVVTVGGDFLSPAAIGTARIDGEPLAGRQAVAVLNLLGAQFATFGNHEFDISEAAFHQRIAESKFQLVSSNVVDGEGRPFRGTVPSAIATVQSAGRTLRIGLIGLTLDFNRKAWVRYLPAVESAQSQVKALAGRVDAIVALTHLGLPGDQALALAVPELDLILGGHEHDNWMLRRGSAGVPIAKADANGRSAVVATLTFAEAGRRPSVVTRIEVMDASVPRQPAVQAEITKWMTVGFDAFRKDGFEPDAPVVTIPEALDGRETTVRHHPGNLTSLVAASMAREVKDADAAILNGGAIRIDDILPAGPIREYDIIRVLPFGGKVVRATLDGALFGAVLEAGVQNQGVGGYLQTWGVSRTDGPWLVQGKPIDAASRYRVAMPEFLLTGGETRLAFLTRTNPQVHDVQEFGDIRQAVIAELKARYQR